ncbi:MAG: hypothetical protein JNL57_01625 [Bacteroidetes bacterium]|nr:hypothetical protein [Bacteroidota bacterium]
MKKIEYTTEGSYLYTGAFDSPNENKIVQFSTDEKIAFNIEKAIETSNDCHESLDIHDLKKICKESGIKVTIYPSGKMALSKLDSSQDELKSCFLTKVATGKANYLVCFAFEETQPALYKAKIVSVYIL